MTHGINKASKLIIDQAGKQKQEEFRPIHIARLRDSIAEENRMT